MVGMSRAVGVAHKVEFEAPKFRVLKHDNILRIEETACRDWDCRGLREQVFPEIFDLRLDQVTHFFVESLCARVVTTGEFGRLRADGVNRRLPSFLERDGGQYNLLAQGDFGYLRQRQGCRSSCESGASLQAEDENAGKYGGVFLAKGFHI